MLSHPRAGELPIVRPLDIPDLIRSNLGLAETGAKGKAGGAVHLPLLLLGLGIVLCVRIAVPFPPCFQFSSPLLGGMNVF